MSSSIGWVSYAFEAWCDDVTRDGRDEPTGPLLNLACEGSRRTWRGLER